MNDENDSNANDSDFWKTLAAGAVGAILGAAGTLLADAILSDSSLSHDDEEEGGNEDENEAAITVADTVPPQAHSM